MNDAIIGYSGFVGSTLRKQRIFEHLYRSTNINEIDGKQFDIVVCAAAPAQKWIANSQPEDDLQKINSLINNIGKIRCNNFILISTVDVFKNPVGVNENTKVEESGLPPYGLHRRMLEKYVESQFSSHLIVRLPGLVGTGLRKNIIFDFLNKNNVALIDGRSVFQFYPMSNLWFDIQIALKAKIRLVHLTAEPISVAEISSAGFGNPFSQIVANQPAIYDMQSIYADLFGGHGCYQYSKRETIHAVRAYAQSEVVCARTDCQVNK